MKASELELPKGVKVYLDMDGVLANFFEEYAKLAGAKSYRDVPPAKVDPTLDKMVGTDFFARLPKFPVTDKIIDIAVQAAGSYGIISSPLRNDFANSEKHKREWIKKHLNPQPTEIFITPNKEKHAVNADGTPNVLIDDRGSNITAWENAGGIGVKFQADEDSLKKILDGLNRARRIGSGEEKLEPQNLKSRDLGKMIASKDDEVEEGVVKATKEDLVAYKKIIGLAKKAYETNELEPYFYDAVKITFNMNLYKKYPKLLSTLLKVGRKMAKDDWPYIVKDIKKNTGIDIESHIEEGRKKKKRKLRYGYPVGGFVGSIGGSGGDMGGDGGGESIQREGDLAVPTSSVKGIVVDLIADKIQQTNDYEQISQWLKFIVGKTLKPRGKMRYTITGEDISEALSFFKEEFDDVAEIDLANALDTMAKNVENGQRLKDVFIMRNKHNMTFKKIGDEIGTGTDRARQVYLRSLRKLRFLLKDYVGENFAESYKLQLERDKEMLVLHIKDTKTGKRTEVRGKLGYESGNYDPNDKLHILLDRVGKSANVSELINGEVVTINPKHPDAERAKKATDVAYNENFADGKKKGKSRPGRVKRSGASCKGSVTSLRKKAKKYSGERGKMYHWCANMKGGKK